MILNKLIPTGMIISILITAGCLPSMNTTTEGQIEEMQTLTIMTHDSFTASEAIIQTFEKQHNVELVFLRSGDTGSALNRAILSKENPLADVFYGVDNTFLTRALQEEIFETYHSHCSQKSRMNLNLTTRIAPCL